MSSKNIAFSLCVSESTNRKIKNNTGLLDLLWCLSKLIHVKHSGQNLAQRKPKANRQPCWKCCGGRAETMWAGYDRDLERVSLIKTLTLEKLKRKRKHMKYLIACDMFFCRVFNKLPRHFYELTIKKWSMKNSYLTIY